MTRHRQPMRRPRYKQPTVSHAERREGDEMACSCGKRWPVGEDHP